jgi:hypothetical protein
LKGLIKDICLDVGGEELGAGVERKSDFYTRLWIETNII